MKAGFRNIAIAVLCLFAAALWTVDGAWPQSDPAPEAFNPDQPLLSVYGPRAPTREGDHDYRQIVYVSMPADTEGEVYLRLFDPDTVSAFDTPFGAHNDTRTKFSVFGGEGAYVGAPATEQASESDPELSAGELLAERTFGADRKVDGKWVVLTGLDPAKGERRGANVIFRLVVRTVSGNDGNIFSLALSSSETENTAVVGARIFAHVATVRVPDNRSLNEIRFKVPEDATSLTVSNFDSSFGAVIFTSAFRSLTLNESGQDAWQRTVVELQDDERGTVAALTLRGGEEIPNDLTVYVTDGDGQVLDLELTPRLWLPNARPEAVVTVTPEDCTAVELSAAGSQDADGDPLEYLWRLADGTTLSGETVTARFSGPGTYPVRLEVTDTSGLVGNGTAQDFQVAIKAPPVAVARSPRMVAPGEPVTFDGLQSHAGEHRIASYSWALSDGSLLSGPSVTGVFKDPGLYRADLVVIDASGHPCNTAATATEVRVNAAPVARAGDDRYVAAGETLTFDASASSDGDGEIETYVWDLGDGTRKTGRVIEHAYGASGMFLVTLTVTDASGASNAQSVDTASIRVNARPLARAGDDVTVVRGEPVTFDGSQSSDRDGDSLLYHWTFGDNREARAVRPVHVYHEVGTYEVGLTVRDGTGFYNDAHSDTLTVTVTQHPNMAPVASAGADVNAVVGEVIGFDASASEDPDGNIAIYDWDFGDGGRTQGVKPVHTFWAPGEYTVTLKVTDDDFPVRATASDTLTVRVSVPGNTAPVAEAGSDLSVKVGDVIAFDASASSDPDGNIVAYEWAFGDGGKARGVAPIHAYHYPGTYSVELVVEDDGPGTKRVADTLTVTVEAR